MIYAFGIGDEVRVVALWRRSPARIRGGVIVERYPWGSLGCYRVDGDSRFFAWHVFERVRRRRRKHVDRRVRAGNVT